MNLFEKPSDYNQVIGHSKAKKILTNSQPFSVIFKGKAGIGKSTLANIYLQSLPMETYRAFGADLTADLIHNLTAKARIAGPISLLLDEIQYLSKKQQSMFLDEVERGKLLFIATTTESIQHAVHPGLASRCRILYLEPPSADEIKNLLVSTLMVDRKTADIQVLERIASCSGGDVRKALIELSVLADAASGQHISAELYEEVGSKTIAAVTVEEYKSALQKSIRGSDVDAASVYALALLKIGELEALCRRLLVIVSEDIGLASANAIPLVTSCVNNALMLGLPEARYPILHAIVWLCLQPKSNSLGLLYQRYEQHFGEELIEPPSHIRYANARGYAYPHAYPSHWVRQQYMPDGFEKINLYEPGENRIEQEYARYWRNVKGLSKD